MQSNANQHLHPHGFTKEMLVAERKTLLALVGQFGDKMCCVLSIDPGKETFRKSYVGVLLLFGNVSCLTVVPFAISLFYDYHNLTNV